MLKSSHLRLIVAAGVLLGASVAAHARPPAADSSAPMISGTTVRVLDGDTITVLAGRTEVRVRLADIDAPEKGMPYGAASKRSLSDLCYRQPTIVHVRDTDRYGRTIGRVRCANVDANRAQVDAGMAWVYDRYAQDARLYAVQAAARAARRGLWSDPAPERPWEWRRTGS